MVGATYYTRDKLLDQLFGGVPYPSPSSIYFGAMTGSPSPSGPGSEPAGGGYARVGIVNNTVSWPTTANEIKTLAVDVDFPIATANQGSIVAVGVFDSPTSGNLLYWWDLDSIKVISSNMKMKIPAGSIDANLLTEGGLSSYVKNGFLNQLFGGTPFGTIPIMYAGYMTTTPTPTTAGTEPGVAGYSRVAFNNTTSMFPAASAGVKQNALAINFPESSGDQGTVTHVGLWDAMTGGNFLGYYSMTAKNIIALDIFQIAPSNITLRLN